MLVDYHVHALAHGEFDHSPEWIRVYLDRALSRGISQIGFSEHDWFLERIDPDIIAQVSAEPAFGNLEVRVGVEVDYRPEEEPKISSFLADRHYDYVIGSVHHLGDWPFDHPDHKDGFLPRDLEDIYQEYYGLVRRMVVAGLFDVIGHLDLIKVWGFKLPPKRESVYLVPILDEVRHSGLVVEVNSGGLRKPVAEVYPSPALLRELFEHNIPITFGSDAHHPDQLGEGLSLAVQQAWDAGYRTMAGFSGRERIYHPITRR